ncbi:MAG: sensor histidine kinase [Eubacteriaceae bacterium]|jgi:signal transduction histidine kinase
MVMKKRLLSLRVIFFEYLFFMALMLTLALLVPYTFFCLGLNTGLYTSANSSEVEARNMEPKIVTANPFNSALVPASCTYVYVSPDFDVLQSNMAQQEKDNAIAYAQEKYTPTSSDDCYLVINRDDGVCILHYYIRSRYTIDWMNRYLPNTDVLLIICCIFNCLVGCFIVTTLFAKRLKTQLHPLLSATEKIKDQDLDFDVQESGIKEFNNVLLSISDMKSELKHSLEEQWRMEQTKQEQTSALAHDIKTPLTVIRGNAELLHDTNLTEEQQKYTGYILKNTDRMERYLRILIDLTRSETGYSINLQNIQIKPFVKDLIDQINGLAAPKQLQVGFMQRDLPQEFTADPGLLVRAIMNVISNAADYSPEHGKISISIEAVDKQITFCVTDSGKGFSQEDLKQATAQFYMGDKSRGVDTHFGIGLYITDVIIKLHHGSLKIENSTETGGGRVTISIPL